MQQELVVETLLSAVNMEAHLSLEPVLMLMGTLARDLQADYLPFLPKIVDALSTVLEQGAAPQLSWPCHEISVVMEFKSWQKDALASCAFIQAPWPTAITLHDKPARGMSSTGACPGV